MARFDKIREAAHINDVARKYLRLKLEGDDNGVLRCHCPRCQPNREGRGVLTIKSTQTDPKRRYFSCHKSEDWGDCISLVAHCHNISLHEAGEQLAKWCLDEDFEISQSDSEPEPRAENPKASKGFDPVKYARHLHQEQEDVSEFGILAELCEEVGGMGRSPKGMNRGKLAIPLRKEDGTLVAYMGVDGDVIVPKEWRIA